MVFSGKAAVLHKLFKLGNSIWPALLPVQSYMVCVGRWRWWGIWHCMHHTAHLVAHSPSNRHSCHEARSIKAAVASVHITHAVQAVCRCFKNVGLKVNLVYREMLAFNTHLGIFTLYAHVLIKIGNLYTGLCINKSCLLVGTCFLKLYVMRMRFIKLYGTYVQPF